MNHKSWEVLGFYNHFVVQFQAQNLRTARSGTQGEYDILRNSRYCFEVLLVWNSETFTLELICTLEKRALKNFLSTLVKSHLFDLNWPHVTLRYNLILILTHFKVIITWSNLDSFSFLRSSQFWCAIPALFLPKKNLIWIRNGIVYFQKMAELLKNGQIKWTADDKDLHPYQMSVICKLKISQSTHVTCLKLIWPLSNSHVILEFEFQVEIQAQTSNRQRKHFHPESNRVLMNLNLVTWSVTVIHHVTIKWCRPITIGIQLTCTVKAKSEVKMD